MKKKTPKQNKKQKTVTHAQVFECFLSGLTNFLQNEK